MARTTARRALLKSATGALFLAPLLRARRLAAQQATPKRLILLFTPNSAPATFFPTGAGRSFTLQAPMAALRGLEKKLLFMRRIDHSHSVANHHESGPAVMFTGARTDGTQKGDLMMPYGSSIDHLIADQIHGGTLRKTFHIGLNNRTDSTRGYISYRLSGSKAQPVPTEKDPAKIFAQLFAGTTVSPLPPPSPSVDSVLASRLDAEVLKIHVAELRAIERHLGAEEKVKLDQHLTSLKAIERDVLAAQAQTPTQDGPPATPGRCSAVSTSGPIDDGGMNDEAKVINTSKLYADLITAAFACDRTRVVSLMLGYSGIHQEGFKGHSQSWHDNVAHRATTNPLFQDYLAFFADRVAYLAKALDAVKEGDGTMLDHTLIVWSVETGINHSHSPKDVPYLLIGGRALGIDTGQFLTFPATRPHPELLTAICNAYGLPIKGIGNLPTCGPMPGVLV